MTDDLLEAFSCELLPEERVEWTGRPDTSVIFHQEDWLSIPFSLLWGGFAIFWLLGASGIVDLWSNHPDRTFQWFGVIWGTPFVLVGQYLIWGRFLYGRWLKSRTYYGMTNKRAIVLRTGLGRRSCTSVYFESLPMLDKHVHSDGKGAISFGGQFSGEWQWGRGNNRARPLTFDDLADVASAYQVALVLYEKARKVDSSGAWRQS